MWANDALTTSTGYTLAEVVGRNPRALFKSGAHDDALYSDLWSTVLRGEVWQGEMTNRRKDGTVYPEMQTINPVRDASGNISHFVAITRDLTSDRKMQAQFLQAQKMESLGRRAGGVAHDFNNLLMVMNGWTEMTMADLPAEHPAQESLAEVLSAGEGAARLTKQLLAFSRQQVAEATAFNVELACRRTRENAAPSAGRGRRSRDARSAGARPRQNGSRSARAGIDESCGQRAGCDAAGRPAAAGNFERHSTRATALADSNCPPEITSCSRLPIRAPE